jgi:hypothetical protein
VDRPHQPASCWEAGYGSRLCDPEPYLQVAGDAITSAYGRSRRPHAGPDRLLLLGQGMKGRVVPAAALDSVLQASGMSTPSPHPEHRTSESPSRSYALGPTDCSLADLPANKRTDGKAKAPGHIGAGAFACEWLTGSETAARGGPDHPRYSAQPVIDPVDEGSPPGCSLEREDRRTVPNRECSNKHLLVPQCCERTTTVGIDGCFHCHCRRRGMNSGADLAGCG